MLSFKDQLLKNDPSCKKRSLVLNPDIKGVKISKLKPSFKNVRVYFVFSEKVVMVLY